MTTYVRPALFLIEEVDYEDYVRLLDEWHGMLIDYKIYIDKRNH